MATVDERDDEEVIVIEDDGLDEIEKNILAKHFGKEEAEKILEEVGTETTPLDAELQEVVDSAPALDEI